MSGHVDPAGDYGDLPGAADYGDPPDTQYRGVQHIHAHSHRAGGPFANEDGVHVHVHDHAADVLDDHSHDHDPNAAVDYFDADGNAMPSAYQPDQPAHPYQYPATASSSGRRPSGGLHRRSQDWGAPADLSSRLTAAADEVAEIQRDLWRVHERLMDNEAELDTADVLVERDELQRVWHRLAQQEAEAHTRLRSVQAAWAQVESDFSFGRERGGQIGGNQMEPWEREWRRDMGLL